MATVSVQRAAFQSGDDEIEYWRALAGGSISRKAPKPSSQDAKRSCPAR